MKPTQTLILVLFSAAVQAQTVETLVDSSAYTMNHACVVAPDSAIYSTDVIGDGRYNGDKVFKTLTDGTTSVFASGISGASGITADTAGNIYVSELNRGRVWKILENGSKSVFASGLSVPAGLAFDSKGNLFVANFQNDRITKIDTNGSKSIFALTDDEPTGIIIDKNDNLYVSHESSHVINKITPAGILTQFVNIPNTKLQYLTFFGDDIFVCGSLVDHRIYRVKPDGSYSVYAGKKISGSSNGELLSSSFNNPTGVAISPDEQTLYIVELNKIRMVSELKASLPNVPIKKNLEIFPNPATDYLLLKHPPKNLLKIDIVNIEGKIVKTVTEHFSAIDISGLNKGTYFLQPVVKDSNASRVALKFVKR